MPEPITWTTWDGPLTKQPKNRTEVYELFGNPGVGKPDKKWEKENLVEVQFELTHGKKKWLTVHKLVEPYLREGLRRVGIARPDFIFDALACYVFRHTRHNPKLPLSYHSWGIAIDVNPKQNFAKEYKRGTGPQLWTPEYNKVWPPGPRTVDKAFVDAMRSCGFTFGSDWNEDGSAKDTSFYDAMHFEFVSGDGKVTLV